MGGGLVLPSGLGWSPVVDTRMCLVTFPFFAWILAACGGAGVCTLCVCSCKLWPSLHKEDPVLLAW